MFTYGRKTIRRKMKTTAPQFDLPGNENTFNLHGERGIDGERIKREREQAAKDKAEAERKQELLLDWDDTAKQYQAV